MEIQAQAFVAAIALALVYVLHGSRGFWARRRWISAAAGVSVAYVFVDVLPELSLRNAAIVKTLGSADPRFAEQRIYLILLLAFLVMYGLQHMVLVSKGRAREEGSGATSWAYRLHVGGFAAYSALIGYLLVERAALGLERLVSFTLAMGIHFLIVNHSLAEEHGDAYRRNGRWWLVASVLAGTFAAIVVAVPEAWMARLFAVLAGGVVITSLGSELPDGREGRFLPFVLGALVFTALLLASSG